MYTEEIVWYILSAGYTDTKGPSIMVTASFEDKFVLAYSIAANSYFNLNWVKSHKPKFGLLYVQLLTWSYSPYFFSLVYRLPFSDHIYNVVI